MSGLSPAATEAMENQAFSLMGRLHVILRREIGRVTDIKYMSSNPEYCLHVLELAAHVSNPDLQSISQRLMEIYFGDHGLFESVKPKSMKIPVAPSARMPMPIEHVHHEETIAPDASESEEVTNTYVGRLR